MAWDDVKDQLGGVTIKIEGGMSREVVFLAEPTVSEADFEGRTTRQARFEVAAVEDDALTVGQLYLSKTWANRLRQVWPDNGTKIPFACKITRKGSSMQQTDYHFEPMKSMPKWFSEDLLDDLA